MKCPACGKRIYKIEYTDGEYVCYNDECPEMEKGSPQEFYGLTQKEIDKNYVKS